MGMSENDRKIAFGRTGGPMGFQHSVTGLRPVGEDGWPMTDAEVGELEPYGQAALDMFSEPAFIDVEPTSTTDTELP